MIREREKGGGGRRKWRIKKEIHCSSDRGDRGGVNYSDDLKGRKGGGTIISNCCALTTATATTTTEAEEGEGERPSRTLFDVLCVGASVAGFSFLIEYNSLFVYAYDELWCIT